MSNSDTLRMYGKAGRHAAQFADMAKHMVDAAKQPVIDEQPDRAKNLSYVLGEQHVGYDKHRRNPIRRLPRAGADGIVEQTDNVITNALMQRAADVVGGEPVFEAVPAGQEPSDYQKAKQVTKYIDAYWDYLSQSQHWRDVVVMAGIHNVVFPEVYWDPLGGRLVNGRPEGDVALKYNLPSQVFAEPGADRVAPKRTRDKDAMYVFVADSVRLTDIRARYGDNRRKGAVRSAAGNWIVYGGMPDNRNVKMEDGTALLSDEDRVSVGAEDNEESTEYLKKMGFGRVLVLRYYEHPTENFPGRYAVIMPDCGDKGWHVLEYREELPDATEDHPEGLFPLCTVWDVRIPGRLAGFSRLAAARYAQDSLNNMATKWAEIEARFGPIMFWDLDWGPKPQDTTRDPHLGSVVSYHGRTHGEKPTWFWPPELRQFSQNAMQTMVYFQRRIEDLMMAHDIALHPRRNPTLGELQLVKQQDQTNLEHNDVVSLEVNGIAPTNRLIMQLIQRHYSPLRIITARRGDQPSAALRVMRDDIHFSDVKIVRASSMPKNRTLMKIDAHQAMTAGMFTSPDSKKNEELRRLYFRIFNLNVDIEWSADELDAKRIDSENQDLLDGKDIAAPHFGQNDVLHMAGHGKMPKMPEFDALEPARQAVVARNWKYHQDLHYTRLKTQADEQEMSVAQLVQAVVAQQQPQGQNGPYPGPAAQPMAYDGVNGPVVQERPGAQKTGHLGG